MPKSNTKTTKSAIEEEIAVANMLEAIEEQSEDTPATKAASGQTLKQITDAITNEQADGYANKLTSNYDVRSEYELNRDGSNANIQKSLTKTRSKLGMPSAVRLLIAAEVDANFINSSVTSDAKRYNVYAADKLADLVNALRDGHMSNAINIAVMKSMFAFRANNEPFTGEMAKAAASDKIRLQGTIQKLLVRHTVSASTASTQSSSTINALMTLGAVKNIGTKRAPIYTLVEGAVTDQLEKAAAAA